MRGCYPREPRPASASRGPTTIRAQIDDVNCIERLIDEHRTILRALEVLDEIADRVTEDPASLADDARALMSFVQRFADTLHHGKEEHLLFPAMEASGEPREGGPIGVMLDEHEQGRAHVRRMHLALEDLGTNAELFETEAIGFTELLREHIEKEEELLFPMAEAMLSADVLAELTERFATNHDAGEVDALIRTLEALETRWPR